MEKHLTDFIITLIQQYPLVMLAIVAGGSAPSTLGWIWERKRYNEDAKRNTEALERADKRLEAMTDLVRRLMP